MRMVLIGFRGTGKTTIARRLALALGCDWIDADVEIELRTGKSIKAIFEAEGEDRFRELEASVLADLLQRDSLVIAAGGGAVLRPESRRLLRDRSEVVWLTADIETILERIAWDPTTGQRRPRLTAKAAREEVEHLLSLREPLYRECAHQIVDTAGKTPEQIVAQVLAERNRPNRTAAEP